MRMPETVTMNEPLILTLASDHLPVVAEFRFQ